MDTKRQTAQIQKIMDLIAQSATDLPPDARPTFIKGKITEAKGDFQRTYGADPRLAVSAMALVDGFIERSRCGFVGWRGVASPERREG